MARRSPVPPILAAAALLALVLALLAAPARAAQVGSGGRLFAPTSFWNTPLPADAPLDPRSGAIMGAFESEVQQEIAQGTGPWIDTKESVPIYTVGAGQRHVRVRLDTGSWGDSLRAALASGVPIPAGARASNGSDEHLTIYQPASDTLWDFWGATHRSEGWHVLWGGVMRDVSSSPGYFENLRTAGGSVFQQANWGATATSLPEAGGVIRVDEVRAGSIDHVLALDVPNACSGRWSWPAQRTDGTSTAANCIPEGARLRLDPHLDLSKIGMPPFTRMLAVAAQRYGVVVRDKTLADVGVSVESTLPLGSDLWTGGNGKNGLLGDWPWNLVQRQFPWGALQLVRMQLHTTPEAAWRTVGARSAAARAKARRARAAARRRRARAAARRRRARDAARRRHARTAAKRRRR